MFWNMQSQKFQKLLKLDTKVEIDKKLSNSKLSQTFVPFDNDF